ncbi:MAG TPA: hydroxysqualene dehydroxylase HpnE [Candidatus Acidoferrales bacterium]|nr:hydroxysqualene dehydroxylase HpnE [Candidatus Acidoferrales bacterium]
MAARRVAVVGAGLAGLAAAVELADRGFTVELFERSRLLGGRATSFVVDGIEVDNGQHVFLACCTEFRRFVERLGMSHCLHLQDRFDALVLSRGGSSRLRAAGLPAPWHLAGSFLGYRHLAMGDKLRLTRALRAARETPPSGTFAQWLGRHGQSEAALRTFWRPFFVPALNASLDEVSAADGTFVLSTAFLNDSGAARFGYATVPLARVAQAAAAKAEQTHVSSPVQRLWLSPGGEELLGIDVGSGRTLAFDAVVLALAPPQLASLAGEDGRAIGLPPLDGFTAHPIVDVHLWHDRGNLGFDFAAVLDSPLQWVFEKGSGYLCCSLSDARKHVDAPSQQIAQECWGEIKAALPALREASLLRSAVTRNPEATFLASPGTRRPGPSTAFPNLALAGSWTDTGWPDTMESAVRSGLAAARAIAQAGRDVAVVA